MFSYAISSLNTHTHFAGCNGHDLKATIYLYKQQTILCLHCTVLLSYQYVRVDRRAFLQGINGTELALVICTDTEVMNHP